MINLIIVTHIQNFQCPQIVVLFRLMFTGISKNRTKQINCHYLAHSYLWHIETSFLSNLFTLLINPKFLLLGFLMMMMSISTIRRWRGTITGHRVLGGLTHGHHLLLALLVEFNFNCFGLGRFFFAFVSEGAYLIKI